MSNAFISSSQTQFSDLADQALISKIIDDLYDKMMADFRINRFFCSKPLEEQTSALKAFLRAVYISGTEGASEQLEDYFTASFARTNRKPSMVTGNDFMFLLDIVGGQEVRVITPLCLSHSHLIKLGPDDFHYDVVMEHLAATLKDLAVEAQLANRLLALAESARDGLLARNQPELKAA